MNIYINKKTNQRPKEFTNKSIFLSIDTWDDWFRYETLFVVSIYYKQQWNLIGRVKIGSTKMGISDDTYSKEKTLDFFKIRRNKLYLGNTFFSVGQDLDYYKTIQQLLDEDEQKEYYETMCDMAYSNSKYELGCATDVSKYSIFRDVTKIQIIRSFRRIATGKAPLTRYDFKYIFPREDRIYNSNSPSIDFEVIPNSDISTNLHSIIGRNGVGKTFIINNIITCFLEEKIQYEKRNTTYQESLKNKQKVEEINYDIIKKKQKEEKEVGLIIYTENDVDENLTTTTFSNIIHVSFSIFDGEDFEKKHLIENKHTDLNYTYVGLNFNSLFNYYLESLSENDSFREAVNNKDSIIIEEFIDIQNILTIKFVDALTICLKNKHKKKLLNHVLGILLNDALFKQSNIEKRINEYDSILHKDIRKFELSNEFEKILNNLKQTFTHFSSGHKIILLSVTTIVAKIEECSLILLDEPETHLHPPLLSLYIRAISYLLNQMNAVGLIATHSPVVLQEIPKKCIWIIYREKLNVYKYRPKFETLGKSLDALTKEAFNFDINKTGFVQSIKDMKTDVLKKYVTKNSLELGLEGRLIMHNILQEKEIEDE